MPLDWSELDGVRGDSFCVTAVQTRLERDPWAGFFAVRQDIGRKLQRRLGLD